MFHRLSVLLVGAAVVSALTVPSLSVPTCPKKATIQYSKSVPTKGPIPLTQVDLCYDTTSIVIDFTAYNETNFYFNSSYKTNDPIYQYEVMEAFIVLGTSDPRTYLEFEVAPDNVTFNALIYNPSKVRAPGAPFDTTYLQTPIADGLTAQTALDPVGKTWKSSARIPFGLFNIDDGQARGSQWRMNFFRTVTSPQTFPNQLLGAWNPPDAANFHKTAYFGRVNFV